MYVYVCVFVCFYHYCCAFADPMFFFPPASNLGVNTLSPPTRILGKVWLDVLPSSPLRLKFCPWLVVPPALSQETPRWGPSQTPRKETLSKKCNKVPWAVTDKGNICVMTDRWEVSVEVGLQTHACRKHSGKGKLAQSIWSLMETSGGQSLLLLQMLRRKSPASF